MLSKTSRYDVVAVGSGSAGLGAALMHVRGAGCGHEPVPHDGHTDYLVEGHLYHPHGDHRDDHGPVEVPSR